MIRTLVHDLVITKLKKVDDDIYSKRFQFWAHASDFLYLYTNDAKIWISHPTTIWESANVTKAYDGKSLEVITESGEIKVINIKNADELPPLRNPDILIGENDLTSLSYLHEPAVLYNLLVRFCHQHSIYTYCGIVLVAINPYEELPIYGNDTIWAYRGRALGELEPHIFAIAEEAFTRLESEKRDQSIIVSGESGAGKTVSAKYVMRYIATVSGSAKETHVEKKVLASSPIMEAIGNAKTTRNDNSSRFGKFIELQFNKHHQITGASMRTYLLEKSRVINQAPEERNYHIFYQLCAARDNFPEFKLDSPDRYNYLSSECVTITGIDDGKAFQDTKNALTTLGFSTTDQYNIFHVLAGVLHLGNVMIEQATSTKNEDQEASYISMTDEHLVTVSELLQVNMEDLHKWLCHRRITSLKEVFDKPMIPDEAIAAKDALSKHLYAKLFDWIVKGINKALKTTADKSRFIGVLDIYGFETFEINSFEQFCINYANEKLQQQFNLHVFKLDQEEYLKENIEWKFIDFYDNQPCIDLIESKLGILDLLDEECRMPKGTDNSWGEKLYSKCTKWKHFSKPRFGNNSFTIKHFADQVEYQTFGFLEKNRDTVIEEQVIVFRESKNQFLRKLFSDESQKLNVPHHAATIGHSSRTRISISTKSSATVSAATKHHKKTVGSQFGESLNALMSTLNATTPHYIRCIKPNDFKLPFDYNPQRAVQQLRACGVLETIRISAAGFPSRVTYIDFYVRYKVLCKSNERKDVKVTCETILCKFIKDEDKYKYGKSKLFFRAGQVAYLERLRSDRLRECCIEIQRRVRGYLGRVKYLQIRKSALLIQRYSRGYLARALASNIRRERAAVKIQKYVRRWSVYRKYKSIKKSVILIQNYGRGLIARRKFISMKYNKAASVIQACVRGWLCRIHYEKDKKSIVLCQSAVRRFLAKKRFREVKREARSMEHIKKLNKGLENKIISLQMKIEEMQKEIIPLKNASHELTEMKLKYDMSRNKEIELKNLKNKFESEQMKLNNVINELQKERGQIEEKVKEKEKVIQEKEAKCGELEMETKKLAMEIEKIKDNATENKIDVEELVKSRIEREKTMILREQDQDREAYQKLLMEKNVLESRVEALEKELTRSDQSVHEHRRSLSNASTISMQDNSRGSPNNDNNSLPEVQQKIDINLVLKLQRMLEAVQLERDQLFQQIDLSEKSLTEAKYKEKINDSFRIQELEIENEKLQINIEKLVKTIATAITSNDNGANELMNQFHELKTELARRRDECSQLRSVLVNNTEGLKNVATTNYSPDMDFKDINEDGELVLAFEAQKKINRQLEEELQWEKAQWTRERDMLKEEILRLKQDNDRKEALLSSNLTKSPQTQSEMYLQSEIARVATENLDIHEKYEILQKEYRKIKNQLKQYLTEFNGLNDTRTSKRDLMSTSVISNIINTELPLCRKKDREYMGMFEFTKDDTSVILKRLVCDLEPSTAITLLPGLPAYIVFMCIRHTDITNDEERVRGLLSNYINVVKRTVKKYKHDLERCILWLSNTVRLLHTLKQYSGEAAYQEENTPHQNKQCLQNFDLYEYRQVLSDVAIGFYQDAVREMEESIKGVAVAAILYFEAIPGLSGGNRNRSQSSSSVVPSIPGAPDALQKQLTNIYETLCLHGVDTSLIIQVFKQLYYFICASTMNNLLLRKDLCHWSRGMQIRYNLSYLEQWTRDQNIQDQGIMDMLQPIIQAAQLLQARKTEADVKSVCDMCNRMSSNQIIKILNLYTPGDEYEERVSMEFIKKVQAELKNRSESQDQSSLLMDSHFLIPVNFSFNPSNIRLEDIDIPEVLDLPMLRKI